HALSPLMPAESILRNALAGSADKPTAVVLTMLAEQTLSATALGSAAAWVVRSGTLLASTAGAKDKFRSLAVALRPEDLVALAPDAHDWTEAELIAAASLEEVSSESNVRRASLLRCAPMEAKETWAPIQVDAQQASWAKTIFNEYGTHEEKL
ncbi:unnamed protein product, partial [Polarella glacialis]